MPIELYRIEQTSINTYEATVFRMHHVTDSAAAKVDREGLPKTATVSMEVLRSVNPHIPVGGFHWTSAVPYLNKYDGVVTKARLFNFLDQQTQVITG